MKIIGGEAEFKGDELFSYITDSGRSSLRLILKSDHGRKKFLLPELLCKIVTDIFNESNLSYSFYKIKDDLSIDFESLENEAFDALYVIDYFGKKDEGLGSFRNSDVLIIEDSVFLPVLDRPEFLTNWVGFNSFRKISFLGDGSIIKATFKMNGELVHKQEPAFSALKYKAKAIKHAYINSNLYSEDEYLKLYREAEDILDRQEYIYAMSNASLFNLFGFYTNMEKEYEIRKNNFKVMDQILGNYGISNDTDYPSFYALGVDNRDELKSRLSRNNIFLPTHWPNINKLGSNLYSRLLTIPVDSRYCEDDMERIAELIMKLIKERQA